MFAASPAPVPGLFPRFTQVMDGLKKMLAAHAGRHPETAPLIRLLWNYLSRASARLVQLVERPPRPAKPRKPHAPEPLAEPPAPRTRKPPPELALPRRFAWLAVVVPGSPVFGSQLRALVEEPEIAAWVAATPAAIRLLRPLFRMLAVERPPGIPIPPPRPPQPPRPPRAPRAARSRSRRLPPGVLAHGPTSIHLTPVQLRRSLGLPARAPSD